MKTPTLFLLCLFAFVFLAGCNKSDQNQAPAAPRRPVIAVIPKGTTHEFWKAVHAGAERAAKELDVDIVWKGPLKEDDRESQIKIVEDFTIQKVDGIVLQDPDNMGYMGVKTMVMHLNGETVPNRIDTGATLATPDNMNDPQIKKLF